MGRTDGIPVWREIGLSPIPQSQAPEETQILIVGGGPVGLTLALDLARSGRKLVLVNQLEFIAAGSKAICFAKRTLDIWERLGVAKKMIDKGVVWNVGKVFYGDASDPIYQFDMLPIKEQKHPSFINLQQYYVEEILVEELSKYDNVQLRWGHKATAVEQSSNDASVQIETPQGSYGISAEWVIACDGHRSTIRKLMGLDFEGQIFEDNFLIADVKFKQERPSERWFWFDPPFNPGRSALLHKQPDDVWRLDFQLGWNVDRVECVKPENVEPFVRGMIGDDVEFEEEWYSVYTFQCRRMRRFVHGRIVFAGDSAHQVSPFGARGCNGGVADADNLAWKLNLILSGDAQKSLIESYDYEAIVTADENILNSTRSTEFMTPKSEGSVAFRNAVLDLAEEYKFAQSFVNSGRLSTPVGYPDSALNTPDKDAWDGGVPPGNAAIDAPLGEGWLLDQLGDQFAILENRSGLNETELGSLHIVTIDLSTADESRSIALERYQIPRGGAYLIRPDQYVAARWKSAKFADVQNALARAKGSQ